MSTGSITSLGLGSGLDLQDILDQLREVEEEAITLKEEEIAELELKVDAYNTVNAKLFSIKSDVLNLSLESNFLNNSVSISDEDVISATVGDGYDEASYSIDVTQLAQRNSWESTAVSSSSDVMFSEPESGITDVDTTAVTTEAETLTISYGEEGEEQEIDISLSSGLTLTEIVDEINNSSNNQDSSGNQPVEASFTLGDNGDYYITLSAANGGDTADSEITVSGFDWVAADTTIAISQGDSTIYLSVPPGTTYEGMADLINDSENNPGVTASIINNGDESTPYQLTLVSDEAGEDCRITLENFDEMTEATGAGGASLNAEFSVNGISYTRQSNDDIDDVITGVTFDLEGTGETTLEIEISYDSVKEDVISMIEGFNDLISYLQYDEDSTETEESLSEADNSVFENDSSASRISYKLQNLLTTITKMDSGYTSLADIGLEINSDGTIEIDEDVFDEAVEEDPEGVMTLFLGDDDAEIDGIADIFNDALSNMVSTSGIASTEIDDAEARIERLDEYIETETERLETKYEAMADEFTQLDVYISELESQASTLESMIEAFSSDD